MSDLIQRLQRMSRERRGYLLGTLPEHLEASGGTSRLHSLLYERECIEHRLFQPQQKRKWLPRLFHRQKLVIRVHCENLWYAAQEKEGNTSAFVADIARAWRLGEAESRIEIEKLGRSHNIGFEARYALMTASMNTLGAHIPRAFLARLVESGVWTTTQGLAYAQQIPVLNQRALALSVVAKYVINEHTVLKQALDLVLTIKDEGKRADALALMSPYLSQPLLHEAAVAAEAIKNDEDRVRASLQLATHLTEPARSEILEQASASVQKLKREEDRLKALLVLEALRSDQNKQARLEQVLQKVNESSDVFWQLEMIEQVAFQLPEPLLLKAQHIARGIKDEHHRTNALLALSARGAKFGRGDETLREVERANATPGSGHAQAKALATSMPHLNRQQMNRAFKLMRRFHAKEDRAKAIAGMAPFLPEHLLGKALTITKKMNVEHQAIAMEGLAARLAEPEKTKLLNEVLQEIVRRPGLRIFLREKAPRLAPHLPPASLRLVLPEISKLDDGLQIIKTAITLARESTLVKETELTRILLNFAQLLTDEKEQSEGYAHIASFVAHSNVDEALVLSQTIEHPDKQAEALVSILPKLSAVEKNRVLWKIVRSWDKDLYSHDVQLPAALKLLAPFLSESLWQEALKIARKKKWESCRGGMLAALVHPNTSAPVLQLIMDEVRQVSDERARSATLVRIAEQFAHLGHYEETMEIVQTITEPLNKVSVFDTVIPHLSLPYLDQMIPLINGFSFEGSRWSINAVLAPRLAELGELDTAVEVMLSIRGYHRRALAAARIAVHAPLPTRSKLIDHALTIVRNAQRELEESEDWWQTEVLTCLAPYLSDEILTDAFKMASEIESADERFAPLSALSLQLAKISPLSVHFFWSQALRRSAARSRANLLSDIRALAPFIKILASAEAGHDVIVAICDVGQCWSA
jgi:hypothetical protein